MHEIDTEDWKIHTVNVIQSAAAVIKSKLSIILDKAKNSSNYPCTNKNTKVFSSIEKDYYARSTSQATTSLIPGENDKRQMAKYITLQACGGWLWSDPAPK